MTAELEIRAGGALAVSADQTHWSDQQIAVLQSMGVSGEVTSAELDVFLHECQRTGLDPFTRQIYLIGRYDKQAGRKVFRSQTGIDGYRVVAHRAGRRDHVKLGYSETEWCGPDGVWRTAWLWERPPLAAKITVYRDGEPFPAIAHLNEYAERSSDGNLKAMWQRMPANQLAKCAEALALRKAFPHDLGGIYTDTEMGQADNEQPSQPVARMTPERPAISDAEIVPEIDLEAHWASEEGKRLLTRLHTVIAVKYGPKTDAERHEAFTKFAKRPITSAKQMHPDEVRHLIGVLERQPDFQPAGESQAPEPEQSAASDLTAEQQQYRADLETRLLERIGAAASMQALDEAWSVVQDNRQLGALTAEQEQRLTEALNGRESALKIGAAA